MMPLSFFYKTGSLETCDYYVRLSIGKFPETIDRLVSRLL